MFKERCERYLLICIGQFMSYYEMGRVAWEMLAGRTFELKVTQINGLVQGKPCTVTPLESCKSRTNIILSFLFSDQCVKHLAE